MNKKRFAIAAGVGCGVLLLVVIIAVPVLLFFPLTFDQSVVETRVETTSIPTLSTGAEATQVAIPTITAAPQAGSPTASQPENLPSGGEDLTRLYEQLNPGVVNIQVIADRVLGGQGAGSGFILDNEGHILTNNHVVAEASFVTVVFYNGFEAEASIVGTDDDSDLAVLKVEQVPETAHPLLLGDSDSVDVGDWVIAIGNPFRLGGSLTAGIVSAVGRSIPSGVTPFSIPQAIQTDAAINPGNSGGPLLNLDGDVIGVNAQIASAGTQGNLGVGFAIPVNVVRRVAPVLIKQGQYQWSWLGVEGGPVDLLVARANQLESQNGAYIHNVVDGSPADKAGLKGSTGSENIQGGSIPVGGDVIIEANGEPLEDFNDLLVQITFSEPGTDITLTIMRDGERQQLNVTLEPRPQNFEQDVNR